MITCTAAASRFFTSRELFHQVAQSFKVPLPPLHESLKIDFPADRAWKIQNETDDSTAHFMQVMPSDETADKWTIFINLETVKQKSQQSIEQVLSTYKDQIKGQNGKAHFTVLSKGDNWSIFKVEPDTPTSESGLYYLLLTDSSIHMISVMVTQPVISDDLLKKWTGIFRNGKLAME
ncbi:hypothetical protein SAMN05428949_6840 [Chitinophaga sp. YR627]|uniref:hypothetical protein n=1 Tax=Chitinophaga sp. YR627 TaxID=1881041 RepID=UPI0008DF169C|nr:hypothetical protein [Chitinophaga sp. YR627]SFO87638.1 hypothetical protein SAMN05428949_6840 [Chitinophaga sp. YR627]